MSAHKSIDRICVVIVALTLVITLVFCNGQMLGIETAAHKTGYEERIFDRSKVHTFDIVIDDWDSFISTCENEQYSPCSVVIDGEAIKNVGIRGKGNTSLSSVKNMDSERYSFKVEFDQYEKGKTYHGLDKLCLNNIIQDNTYMKDYLAYTLMYDNGVDAPLCSYVYITVNGEDWGLYLAVEAIEESFLERNYGSGYGELYKPDSMSFGGGGPGNGKDFSMTEFIKDNSDDEDSEEESSDKDSSRKDKGGFGGSMPNFGNGENPFGGNMPDFGSGENPSGGNMPDFNGGDRSESGDKPNFGGGFGGGGFGGFGMGNDDVKLKYTDDDIDSYSNIFGNAKTAVDTADKKRLIRSLKALSEQTDLENTVDIDEVIRYFAVHNFLVNGDSYTGMMIHNYYLYEKDGQLSMIPWDYNLAYGSFSGGQGSSSVNSPIDTPVSDGMSDRPMISWIFDNEEYTEMYHHRLREFLDSSDFGKIVDDTAAMIDKYVEKDPTKFCTYEEFQTGAAAMRSFCTLRAESVRGQLDGTIPSTSEGQSADSSALVDTGDLNLSALGSMGGGFGGGPGGGDKGGFGGGNGKERDFGSFGNSGDFDPKQAFGGDMSEGFDPSQGFGGDMPEGFDPSQGFGGDMPEGFDPSQGFGGEKPSGFTPKTDYETEASAESETAADNKTEPQSEATPENERKPEESGERSERPASDNKTGRSERNDFPPMNNSRQDNSRSFILLGVSALVLLLGLIFAGVFRR